MAQEYTVTAVKTTGNQDANGNDVLWVSFNGVQDSAMMLAKKHPEIESKEYGDLTTEKGKTSGKEYLRFRRVQREEGQEFHAQAPSQSFKGRDDNHIRAQWAIGQAMTHFAQKDSVKLEDVEVLAKALYEMVDRVKTPKADGVYQEQKTGYDAFKQAAEAVKEKVEDLPPVDAYHEEEIDDTPIDLSEIPF